MATAPAATPRFPGTPLPGGLLQAVARCHADVAEALALHQEALLLGELRLAAALLDRYRALQRRHIDFEDTALLPRAARGGFELRWPLRLYTAEHRRIEQLLEGVTRRLAALRETDEEAALRAGALALLEAERRLQHVCEHHEAREEQDLLPRLDRWLPDGPRRALAARFTADWQAALAGQAALRDTARARLDALRFRRDG